MLEFEFVEFEDRYTVCSRRLDPFHIESYSINWVKTSWTVFEGGDSRGTIVFILDGNSVQGICMDQQQSQI